MAWIKDKNTENNEVFKTEIASLKKELDKRAFYLSVLYSVGEDVVSILELNTLLKITVDMFSEIMRTKNAVILLDTETGGFKIRESKGLDKNFDHVWLSSDSGLIKFLSQINHPVTRESIIQSGYKPLDSENKVLEELHTVVLSPLMFKGQMIGLLSLGKRENQEKFQEDDYELLSTLTSQIAVAISNAQLYKKLDLSNKELDKKIFDLMTLHKMSKAISSVLDLDKLKELVMDVFLEVSRVNKGVIFLIDDDEIKIAPAVYHGFKDDELKHVEFLIESKFVEKLLKEKELLIFTDGCNARDLTEYQFNEVMVKELENSGLNLFIPLIASDKLEGLIALGNKLNHEVFLLSELQLFSTLASQVAITIENARLYELAIRDGLTRAFIHRYFQQQLVYEIKRSNRYKRPVGLVMLDIDNFKELNDTYGHQIGDLVLKETSRLIKTSLRDTDIICRYGGDEFAVILPEVDMLQAKVAADRVWDVVQKHDFRIANDRSKITVSIGLASYPNFATSKDDLIKKADQALYKSKRDGKNRVTLYSDM